jgi:hypothetical protein
VGGYAGGAGTSAPSGGGTSGGGNGNGGSGVYAGGSAGVGQGAAGSGAAGSSATGAGGFGGAGAGSANGGNAGSNSAAGSSTAGASGAGNAGTSGVGTGGGGAGGAGAGGTTSSPCSAPGLLFCDDFEARPLGSTFSAPWTTTLIGGTTSTITIDDSVPAHSGTHSVRTHPTDEGYQTLLVFHDPNVLPVKSGRFYVRAEVRFDTAMSAQHNTFLMATLFSAPDSGTTARVGEDNQMLIMTVGGDAHGYNSNFDKSLPNGIAFQPRQWECLELMFDAPNMSFDVWVDGQEVLGLSAGVHAMPPPLAHDNYDTLRLGFEKYAGPVTDIWWDDVAIGTTQIGCP